MPVTGVQGVIDRMVAVLKQALPDALADIDANLADGVVTPVPQNADYFTDEDPAIGGEFPAVIVRALVSDLISAQEQTGAPGQLLFDHNIAVDIFMRCHDTYDFNAIQKFGYRYGTALALVLYSRRARLELSGTPLPGVVSLDVGLVRYMDVFDDGGAYIGRTSTAVFTIRRQEIDD